MKKLLTVIGVLISVFSFAQPTTDYTRVSQRYDWLGGYFRALHIPAGTTPALATRQWPGAGAVYVDSTNHLFYFYSGGVWRTAGGATNSNVGTAFRLAIPGTNNIKTLIQRHGLIIDSTTANSLGFQVDTTTAITGLATIGDVDRGLALKLNLSDTSSMLTPYLRKADTTGKWVTQFYRRSDSVFWKKGASAEVFAYKDSVGSGGGSGDTTKIVFVNPLSYLDGVSFGSASIAQQTEAFEAAIADALSKGYGIQFDGTWNVRTDSLRITNRTIFKGVGEQSKLISNDTSGAVLTVNNVAANNYYNVVFEGYKGVTLRDFQVEHVSGDSTPNTNHRGILFTASGGQTQRNLVQNVTIKGFYVGFEGHNIHASDISQNYFRNNKKADLIITGTASNDYGDLNIHDNYFSISDTVKGEYFSLDSTAAIRIDYGSAIKIYNNKLWGYHDFGIWFDARNTTEDFEAVARTETFVYGNTISYQQNAAILFTSRFGKVDFAGNAFNGNRFADINLQHNFVNNCGKFFVFDGGANAFSNVMLNGNTTATVTITQPSEILLGSSVRTLTLANNVFNNQHFGTSFNFGGRSIDIVSGSLNGTINAYNNTYIGWDNASDIPETVTLQSVTNAGSTTTNRISVGNGISNAPTYMGITIGDFPFNPGVGAIGATNGSNSGKYATMRYNGTNAIFGAYDHALGNPLPIVIGEGGSTINANGNTTVTGSFSVTNIPANRTPYTMGGSEFTSDANYGYDGSNLRLGTGTQFGKFSVETNSQLDGIRLRGNDYPAIQIRNGSDIYMYLAGITANTGLVSNSLTGDVVLKGGVTGGRVLINGTGTGTSAITAAASAVAINKATDPDASSVLDIVSTTKGMLVPRMNTTQQDAISSPATGLLIFNTDSVLFRYYTGSAWTTIGGGSGGGSGITQLTGDVTAGPGSGSQGATLATVNSNVGSFTNANITVNAKGLITAAANGTATQWTTSGSDIYRSTGKVTVGGTAPNGSNVFTVETDGSALSAIAIVDRAASGHTFWFHPRAGGTAGNFGFYDETASSYRFFFAGANMGVGNNTSPTALIHPNAGTTTVAPLKFTSGTNLTTPEAGAMEYNGTSLFFSPSTTRLRAVLTNNSIPSNGQLPIGNGTNYTNATITAGTGISVTNGSGSITLAANGVFNTAMSMLITTVSTNTTAGDHYTILVDASGASRTISLPAAAEATGRVYVIKKIDASGNNVVIDADGSENIDGATTQTISVQYNSIMIQCDGSAWYILANK